MGKSKQTRKKRHAAATANSPSRDRVGGEEVDSGEIVVKCNEEQLDPFDRAMLRLLAALEDGIHQFYKRSGDGGRAGAIIQLEAAIKFIEALGGSAERGGVGRLMFPLHTLVDALNDLSFNTVGSILKPPKRLGHPPLSSSRKLIQWQSAKTLQILYETQNLYETGMSLEHAAKAVAKTLRQTGFVVAAKDDDWEAVKKWREQVQEAVRKSPDDPTAKLYHRDLEAWREEIAQMRRDGFDHDGDRVDDREICHRVLDRLAFFVIQHGSDDVAPGFLNQLFE